ncbi:hypothetical protein GQ457_03G035860 [Hibiscus cannabinus]
MAAIGLNGNPNTPITLENKADSSNTSATAPKTKACQDTAVPTRSSHSPDANNPTNIAMLAMSDWKITRSNTTLNDSLFRTLRKVSCWDATFNPYAAVPKMAHMNPSTYLPLDTPAGLSELLFATRRTEEMANWEAEISATVDTGRYAKATE